MKKRLITAIVLLAIFIPLIIIGGMYFEIALAILSTLAFKEMLDLIEKEKKIPFFVKIISYISVIVLTLCAEAFLPCVSLKGVDFNRLMYKEQSNPVTPTLFSTGKLAVLIKHPSQCFIKVDVHRVNSFMSCPPPQRPSLWLLFRANLSRGSIFLQNLHFYVKCVII